MKRDGVNERMKQSKFTWCILSIYKLFKYIDFIIDQQRGVRCIFLIRQKLPTSPLFF